MKETREQLRRLLEQCRQREGMTLQRFVTICEKHTATADGNSVLQHRFVTQLASSLNASTSEALFRYIGAVVSRVDEKHRRAVEVALNFEGRQRGQLGERRRAAAESLGLSETSYRNLHDAPALTELCRLLAH